VRDGIGGPTFDANYGSNQNRKRSRVGNHISSPFENRFHPEVLILKVSHLHGCHATGNVPGEIHAAGLRASWHWVHL
jgi:hypothetical protein